MSQPMRFASTSILLIIIILFHTELTTASPLHGRSLRLSRGATAGLGIGIAVVSVLLIVVCILLILHFRQQRHITTQRPKHDLASPSNVQLSRSAREKHNSSTSASTITNGDIELDISQDAKKRSENLAQPVTDPQQSQTRSSLPKRNKSIRDRLMGPLYRDSRIILAPKAAHVRSSGSGTEIDRTDNELDEEYARLRDERNSRRSVVNSYSSRRVTRLMMYM